MEFHTAEQLGPSQHRLPSGSLLVRDVPLARVGVQHYGPAELPDLDAQTDSDGMFAVHRTKAEVFRPDSVASFTGIPVVMRHPGSGDVDPSNWRSLSVGHVVSARRGDPPNDDMLVGDIIVHDRIAIDAIRHGGWRAVSVGYTADYETDQRGRVLQRNVVANHLAVLHPSEDARCGPRCAIGDAVPARKGRTMLASEMSGEELDRLLARAFRKRRRSRDQADPSGMGNYSFPSSEQSPMGRAPDPLKAGAELVMTLPSDRFRYFISRTDSGAVGLFRHVLSEAEATSTASTGRTIISADTRTMLRGREREQQQAQRSIAARTKAFWQERANANG
jgi:hypothetical protein